jgi:hypothetical protein
MYAGESPIIVPELWFGSYYNTRYALAILPLLAVAGAGVVLLASRRLRPWAAMAAVAVAVTPWLIRPQPDDWICWKEAQVNSQDRRALVREIAQLLETQYQQGTGIYTSFGDDLLASFREAGIPLKEALRDANEPAWMAATTRPEWFLHEEWTLAASGDPVDNAVRKATLERGPRYYRVQTVKVKDQPVIEVYKRD